MTSGPVTVCADVLYAVNAISGRAVDTGGSVMSEIKRWKYNKLDVLVCISVNM